MSDSHNIFGGSSSSTSSSATATATAAETATPTSPSVGVVATSFDPKSPATIAFARYEEEKDEQQQNDSNNSSSPTTKTGGMVFSVDTAHAGHGISCNEFESVALMSMIDARDEYLNGNNLSVGNGRNYGDGNDDDNEDDDVDMDVEDYPAGDDDIPMSPAQMTLLRRLSSQYRFSLRDCIIQWRDSMMINADKDEGDGDGDTAMVDDTDQDQKPNRVALGQIELFYAVVHLSEIFLLIPLSPPSTNQSLSMETMMLMGGESTTIATTAFSQDTINSPGAVSAETVQYLRLHHLGSAKDMFDDDVIQAIETKQQPDQWNDGADYWNLIMSMAIRGCLEDVWELLTHHSTYRRLQARGAGTSMAGTEDGQQEEDIDEYQLQWLQDAKMGFEALRAILLSAPIPGGRNANSDFDGPEPADGDSDLRLEESVEYIDGLPLSSYRLWEKTDGSSFHPQAAYQAFQLWQEAIEEIEPLRKLRSKIRPIDNLLSLLAGKFSSGMFESWQEELCADILYVIPNVQPVDINVRAREAMENNGSSGEAATGFDRLILAIMRGNARSAIQGMYMLGGDSGAALPALTTSLLAQLLSDAQALDSSRTNVELQTDLLIEAASAIRSSLSIEGRDELGVRLTVQLLLPYASRIGCDVRITANMIDAVEHHSPSSDAEAKRLLSFFQSLIERKNVRVLDACSAICLARYSHYIREHQPAGAAFWLATGMELESTVLCDQSSQRGDWQRSLLVGPCYQRLVSYFSTTAHSLLMGLCGESEGTSLIAARAKEMIEPGLDDSRLSSFIPEVKVLRLVLTMAEAVLVGGQDEKVASSIVSCLEETTDEEDDGVVSSLASPSMHWNLLRLAVAIIERDSANTVQESSAVSSFDVRGMGVLFATLTVLKAAGGIYPKNSTPEWAESVGEVEVALAQGLKRAFISENAARQHRYSTAKSRITSRPIYSSNMTNRPREEQERVVKSMLDY